MSGTAKRLRVVLLGIVVVLSVGAAAPHEETRDQSGRRIADALEKFVVESNQPDPPTTTRALDRPCSTSQALRTSDLCAQWTAADAAQNAAFWAMISAIVSVVGTGGVLWALRESRHGNKIAAAVYETDTRPILVPHTPEFRIAQDKASVEITLVWLNVGKLPASIFFDSAGLMGDTVAVVLAGKTYRSKPLRFELEALRLEEQTAIAKISYRQGVGRSKSVWNSEVQAPVLPTLIWPHPNENSVYSGYQPPSPDAYEITRCQLDDRRQLITLE